MLLACTLLDVFIDRFAKDSRSDDNDLELIWKALLKLGKHISRQQSNRVTAAFQSLFLNLSRYQDQERILTRFKALIQSSDEGQIFFFASKFKLKVRVKDYFLFTISRFIRKKL